MMFLLAAAAIASTAPQTLPAHAVRASVQARATIRIISGAELRLSERSSGDGFVARDSVIRSAGVEQQAKLIEFQ